MNTQTTAPPGYVHEQVLADLAQVLAHRIRGLVASIEGFTDLLTDTLYSREQRELALRIFEGASRIETVLAELQLYGQPVDPVLLPTRVGDLADEVLAPLGEEERARIEVRLEAGPDVALHADPHLMRQALLVVVKNALDATRRGGEVRFTAVEAPAGRLRFDVWNEGAIELEDAAEQVFLPFFTTKAHNLGVGLSMARRIVELHGGTLRLSANDPDGGTCFTLEVPRDAAGPHAG